MAEEKETGIMAAVAVLCIFMLFTGVVTGIWFNYDYGRGCQGRCYPQQMESMTPSTGCICAEAK